MARFIRTVDKIELSDFQRDILELVILNEPVKQNVIIDKIASRYVSRNQASASVRGCLVSLKKRGLVDVKDELWFFSFGDKEKAH